MPLNARKAPYNGVVRKGKYKNGANKMENKKLINKLELSLEAVTKALEAMMDLGEHLPVNHSMEGQSNTLYSTLLMMRIGLKKQIQNVREELEQNAKPHRDYGYENPMHYEY